MAAPHVQLVIDVTTDGHTIVGTVTTAGRPPVAFSGRIGILQAIDDAVAALDADPAPAEAGPPSSVSPRKSPGT